MKNDVLSNIEVLRLASTNNSGVKVQDSKVVSDKISNYNRFVERIGVKRRAYED